MPIISRRRRAGGGASPNATHLTITTAPGLSGTTPYTLSPQPVVAAQNAGATTDTTYVTNVVASLNVLSGSPVLSGTTTKTPVSGVATFTDLVVTGAGTWTITFTSGTLTSATSSTGTTTLDRYNQLASDLSGSGLVGIYDKDKNASAASWAPAYGPSAPTLAATGTPTYSGVDGFTTDGSSNYLASPAVAALDASAGEVWIAAVGIFGSAQIGEVALGTATGSGFGTRYLTLGGATSYGTHIHAYGQAADIESQVLSDTTTQRLVVIQDSALGNLLKADVLGSVAGQASKDNRFQTVAANNALGVGSVNAGGIFTTARKVKFVAIGIGTLTAAHVEKLRQYAATYHGQTYADTAKALVAVGDSRTFGQGSTTPATDNWVSQLLADAAFSSYLGVNMGVTSRKMSEMLSKAPYMVSPLYSSHRPKNLCILGPAGTNDIAGGTRTDAQVIADIQSFATQMRAAGFTVIGCPELPRNLSTLSGNMTEFNYLKAVRDWMVTQVGVSTYFDRVVTYSNAAFTDWTAAQGNTLVSSYSTLWNADGLHLLTAGYAALKTDINSDLVAWGGL